MPRLLVAAVCVLVLTVAAPTTSTADTGFSEQITTGATTGEPSPSACTPGEGGCLPTPEQCSTGGYNGYWEGRSSGHFAVCVGGAGQIASYAGGTTAPVCGVVIVAGVVAAQDDHGRDPNDCPVTKNPAEVDATTLNMNLRANLPPVNATDPNKKLLRRQTDLAFWRDLAFAGSDQGVRVIDISSPARPRVLADLDCYGPQGDVSVYDDLVVLSVNDPMTTSGCAGSIEAADPKDPGSFEGLRVFRLSDLLAAEPDTRGKVSVEPVATVPVDCGSHTNTLLPHGDRVLVYVSATAYAPGPRCRNERARSYTPANEAVRPYSPVHGKISIVEIPLADPAKARIVSEPLVTGPIYSLELDEGTQVERTPETYTEGKDRESVSCHDITISVPLRRAAAACLGDGQLWDLSDPVHPDTVNAVHLDNRQVHNWHSAAFSSDGTVAIFSDEPIVNDELCQGRATRGRLWFYPVPKQPEPRSAGLLSATSNPTPLGSYQIPRSEGSVLCYAHNFNVIPVAGRDLAVVSAYGGGVSVVDFTFPDKAREVAYFDVDGPDEVPSMSWSAYWYNGLIYSNDGLDPRDSKGNPLPQRGFDVVQLHDFARGTAQRLPYLNPQTQDFLLPWR